MQNKKRGYSTISDISTYRFVVGKACEKDIPDLEKLLFENLESRTQKYEEGFVQNSYSNDLLTKTWVVRDRAYNRTVAMCVTDPLDDSTKSFYGIYCVKNGILVHYTCVSKEVRREGLATSLYDAISCSCSTICKPMYVEIQHSPHHNTASISFHIKYGFLPIAQGEYKSQIFVLYQLKKESFVSNCQN